MVKFVTYSIVGWLASGSLIFAAELQDPTRPVLLTGQLQKNFTEAVSQSEAPLLLQSVLVSAERRLAMVNGQMLKVGDKIGGYTVTRIEPQQLELSDASKNIKKLQLYQAVKKSQ